MSNAAASKIDPLYTKMSGRVFLSPAPCKELCIPVLLGIWTHPEWMPFFEEVISKSEYDRLCGKIKLCLESHGIPKWKNACGMTMFCCLPCGFWACWSIIRENKACENELHKICEEFNGARFELPKTRSQPTGYGDQQTFDQHGHPLLKTFDEDEEGRNGVVCPSWPPPCAYVILKVPEGVDLRMVWPRSPAYLATFSAKVKQHLRESNQSETGKPVPACAQCGQDVGPGKCCSNCGARSEPELV